MSTRVAEHSLALSEELRMGSSPYVTIEEAAAYARCNPRTIRRWLDDGKIVRRGAGRRVLIRRDDLARLLDGDAQAPRPAGDP